jgi:hypothetical protein
MINIGSYKASAGWWVSATFVSALAAGIGSASQASPNTSVQALHLPAADLGVSIAVWRAGPPPAPLDPKVMATCSSDPDGGVASLKPTSAQAAAGIVVCGYVSHWGRYGFPQRFALEGPFRTNSVRYLFRDGRLSEIDCAAPVDAYNALMATLTLQYGPATHTFRDRVATELGDLPRVTQTWDRPSGLIELKDPVAPFSQLQLRIAGPTLTPPRKGAAGV